MNKKSVEKPLTEKRLIEILPVILEKSFDRAFPPAFDSAFKPAFQEAFEPFALVIQQDFAKSKDRDESMAADISEMKSNVSDLQDGHHRIEQRQLAEIKRKDFLSIRLDNHEKRIVSLEKNPTR